MGGIGPLVPPIIINKGTVIVIIGSLTALIRLSLKSAKPALLTVPLLIIMGGIGPLVFLDLVTTQKLTKLKLHSKIRTD
jgi:hypothetical protein